MFAASRNFLKQFALKPPKVNKHQLRKKSRDLIKRNKLPKIPKLALMPSTEEKWIDNFEENFFKCLMESTKNPQIMEMIQKTHDGKGDFYEISNIVTGRKYIGFEGCVCEILKAYHCFKLKSDTNSATHTLTRLINIHCIKQNKSIHESILRLLIYWYRVSGKETLLQQCISKYSNALY